jgi:hypothetical protein
VSLANAPGDVPWQDRDRLVERVGGGPVVAGVEAGGQVGEDAGELAEGDGREAGGGLLGDAGPRRLQLG